SNLMGEIITIQTKDKEAKFQLFKTFSENYDDHQKIFEYPRVVVDNVDNLYKRGYRHFIYIAKVPYSSTLHSICSASRHKIIIPREIQITKRDIMYDFADYFARKSIAFT
ncbi:MAG: hypothetical protein ACKPFK_30560, partial [Dolichospermum sp.]